MPKRKPEGLWDLEDMCRRYAVTDDTYREWDRAGEAPPGFLMGRFRYWQPAVVEAWERARTQKSA